jgi:hypothetical protein
LKLAKNKNWQKLAELLGVKEETEGLVWFLCCNYKIPTIKVIFNNKWDFFNLNLSYFQG